VKEESGDTVKPLIPSATAATGAALALSLGAQTPGTSHESHLKVFDTDRAMTSSSPYPNLSWSYLGPTNVSGRVADVAAADHGTSRRL
jgi:hypothetical protein